MMSPQWGLGSLGDKTVPGDYDGDGKPDVRRVASFERCLVHPENFGWRDAVAAVGLGSLGMCPCPETTTGKARPTSRCGVRIAVSGTSRSLPMEGCYRRSGGWVLWEMFRSKPVLKVRRMPYGRMP